MLRQKLVAACVLGVALAGSQRLTADTIQVRAFAQAINQLASPNPVSETVGPQSNADASANAYLSSGIAPVSISVGSSSQGVAYSGLSGAFRAGSYVTTSGLGPAGLAPAVGSPLSATGQTTWSGTFTNTSGTPQVFVLTYQIENVGLSVNFGGINGSALSPSNGYTGYYGAEVQATIKVDGTTRYDYEAALLVNANGTLNQFVQNTAGVPAGAAYPIFTQNTPTDYFSPVTNGQLELGVFAPGQSVTVDYVAYTHAWSNGIGNSSAVTARFGDPLSQVPASGGQVGVQQEPVGEVVPEPSTVLLLAATGLGLAWARRRRA